MSTVIILIQYICESLPIIVTQEKEINHIQIEKKEVKVLKDHMILQKNLKTALKITEN